MRISWANDVWVYESRTHKWPLAAPELQRTQSTMHLVYLPQSSSVRMCVTSRYLQCS